MTKARAAETRRPMLDDTRLGIALADCDVDEVGRALSANLKQAPPHRQTPIFKRRVQPQARIRQAHDGLPIRDQLTDAGRVHFIQQVDGAAIQAGELNGHPLQHQLDLRDQLGIPGRSCRQQPAQLRAILLGGACYNHVIPPNVSSWLMAGTWSATGAVS
ncbi:hypothetical protein D3C84_798340 [compost metagenome]